MPTQKELKPFPADQMRLAANCVGRLPSGGRNLASTERCWQHVPLNDSEGVAARRGSIPRVNLGNDTELRRHWNNLFQLDKLGTAPNITLWHYPYTTKMD